MKAVILVGGYGTRLRPLTLTQPKPLVEFANKQMILHQVETLASVGVTTVVLAVSYRAEQLEQEMGCHAERLGVKIHFSQEGGGATGHCRTTRKAVSGVQILDGADQFFVLNYGVISDFSFAAILKLHESGAPIAVTELTVSRLQSAVARMMPNISIGYVGKIDSTEAKEARFKAG